MPVYDYQCKECGATYDVYHKTREVNEDIVCPSCHSTNHKKLMSVPGISRGDKGASECPVAHSCDPGTCCGGACGLN